MTRYSMYAHEKLATLLVACIFMVRMLGIFMLYPILTNYAATLGATEVDKGSVMAAYAIAQAVFQLPLGVLSDKLGRLSIILLGLVLFLLGSILASVSTSIDMLIFARALQGSGAIGSVLLALLYDVTRPIVRVRAMFWVGICIAFAFSAAMVMSNAVYVWLSGFGIFMFMAVAALIAMLLLFVFSINFKQHIKPAKQQILLGLSTVIKDLNLMRLNISILVLHAIFSASFLFIPELLQQANKQFTLITTFTLSKSSLYAISLLCSLFIIGSLMRSLERVEVVRKIIMLAILIFVLSMGLLQYSLHNVVLLLFILTLFFAAFSLLEMILPSFVSRLAEQRYRGAAMGVYTSFQYLGIALGGRIGGTLKELYITAEISVLELSFVIISVIITWLVIMWQMDFFVIFNKQDD